MTRLATSSASRPAYCQMTLTTGMLMLGKISVGVRDSRNGVASTSSNAATTNVYGRRSARRTIHINPLSNECVRCNLRLTLPPPADLPNPSFRANCYPLRVNLRVAGALDAAERDRLHGRATCALLRGV